MKAVIYKKFGTPKAVLEYTDVPTPAPGHGEVLVKLKTSAVNPSDTKKRAGANPLLLDDGPVIPHSDGAGIIEDVGPGVPRTRVGERVWVYNGQYGRLHGTAAEYIALPSEQAVFLPNEASFETGAMMAIPAMTAHRCVFADGCVEGKTILVTGGAGRVGYYAIQWAKYAGAVVISTASNDKSAGHCREAGADLVIPHLNSEANQQILDHTGGQPIDRVIEGDFGANLLPVLDILKTGGTIATYSSMSDMNPSIPFVRMMFMDITIRMVLVYAMPIEAKKAAIKDITNFLVQNRLHNRLAATYPLEETIKAHEVIEQGGIYGSVVVQI